MEVNDAERRVWDLYFGNPTWVVKDETHVFSTSTADPVVKSNSPSGEAVHSPVLAKIRVTFNRPWTWSEREEFREAVADQDPQNIDNIFSEGFTESGRVLTVSANHSSRELYGQIAEYVELYLVNVHPVAVLTVFPKEIM